MYAVRIVVTEVRQSSGQNTNNSFVDCCGNLEEPANVHSSFEKPLNIHFYTSRSRDFRVESHLGLSLSSFIALHTLRRIQLPPVYS